MRRHTVAALAASALAVGSVVVGAQAANADLVTHCVGTGGAVTVPGDLLVPAGESCELTGTTVTGNVFVAAGASLVVTGGTFQRDVQIAADGYYDGTGTAVTGQITLASGGFGIFMQDGGAAAVTVQPKGTASTEGFLFLNHVTVNGNVASSVGDVLIDEGTQITGNLNSDGAFYTDVRDSFVDGTLSVSNNAAGSVVCGSAVQGMSTFTGNQAGVQLGPNGALSGCATGGYFGRDVSIGNTSGPVRVDDNIINGKLMLSGNNPVATVADNNRIRGGITGEHQEPSASLAKAAQKNRVTHEQYAKLRKDNAAKAAKAAGKAF
jgi:hypothetical protein